MPARASDLDLNDKPARASRLFLVDGNGLMFRAFYALPEDISTSDGLPTNALLGFANMLWKLVADYRPAGVLVTWDERPTRRLELDPDYKASRKPTPDLLSEQRPYFRPLVEAFGYRNLSVEGREADDVIGTLSRLADEAGVPTCIVSTDRDAFQLVSDRVCLMMTPRGVSDVQVYTPALVEARLGVPPSAVPDLIGLKGDTGDDIKGVPGIGDKTAADLLRQFGSLDAVYDRIAEVPGVKRRESLLEHREVAELSRVLGTIVRDIPELDGFDINSIVSAPPDRSALAEMLRRFEFRSLLARLDELVTIDAAHESGTPAVEVATTGIAWKRIGADELGAAIEQAEIVGLAADDAGVAVATSSSSVLVVDGSLPGLGAILADGPGIVAHDVKAMPHELLRAGLVPGFDTLLAAYLVEPGRSGYPLDELLRDIGVSTTVESDDARVRTLVHAAAGAMALYGPLDARLAERQSKRLLFDMEQPLLLVLAAMEDAGILVDRDLLDELADRTTAELAQAETACHELAGHAFSIGSPKQLGTVLFEELGLPADRKGKTGYSTDRSVLSRLRDRHPIVPLVERWRELSKLLSTYLLARCRVDCCRWPYPHDLLAGDSRDRPPLERQPEPPEHPRSDAARARDPAGLHRASGCTAPLGRLLAGRAANPRPSLGRAGTGRGLPQGRRRTPSHRSGDPRQARGRADPGRARQGQGRQLRHHLWHLVVRALGAALDPARRGAALHRHVPRPLSEGARVHRDDDRGGRADGVRRDALRSSQAGARAAGAESTATVAGRAPGGQLGDPGLCGGHHQGRDDRLPPAAP